MRRRCARTGGKSAIWGAFEKGIGERKRVGMKCGYSGEVFIRTLPNEFLIVLTVFGKVNLGS
jgi:hypothetical protein